MAESDIRALSKEILKQPLLLEEFSKHEFPKASKGSIFVGAGDSYAVALLGFYASNGNCLAFDPYALASAPEAARGRDVFLVSVSGGTSSNVIVAKCVKRLARKTTALTAVGDSPLAKVVDSVIELPMDYAPRTAGMTSFCLSALAVLRIVGESGRCDFQTTFAKARTDMTKLSLGKGTTYFLGNSAAYPAALYAAAKTYELIGARAHAELLEEFSHLELFSLKKSDTVNVFASFDPLGISQKLARTLTWQGYESNVVPSRGATGMERFFHSVFVTQLWILGQAKKLGIARPRFLTGRSRLRTSDSMIY
jgi:glucosamine 6-phosphate synthetase-like amidotransferase/phosphosugar isomerase protein